LFFTEKIFRKKIKSTLPDWVEPEARPNPLRPHRPNSAAQRSPSGHQRPWPARPASRRQATRLGVHAKVRGSPRPYKSRRLSPRAPLLFHAVTEAVRHGRLCCRFVVQGQSRSSPRQPGAARRRDESKEPLPTAGGSLERRYHHEDLPPPSSTRSIVSIKIRLLPNASIDGEHILEFPLIYSPRFSSHVSL
jgi:hypothetical protein